MAPTCELNVHKNTSPVYDARKKSVKSLEILSDKTERFMNIR